MHLDMDKMQAKRSNHIDKQGEIDRKVVLMSVLKSIYKGIIENVR